VTITVMVLLSSSPEGPSYRRHGRTPGRARAAHHDPNFKFSLVRVVGSSVTQFGPARSELDACHGGPGP
jgi:hypothetical protein